MVEAKSSTGTSTRNFRRVFLFVECTLRSVTVLAPSHRRQVARRVCRAHARLDKNRCGYTNVTDVSKDEHCVAEAVEPVALTDGFGVRGQDAFAAGKRTD